MNKEEYEKKITELRNEANTYRTERRDLINLLTKKRVEATNSDDDVSTVRSIDINGNKKKRGGRRKKKKDDGPGITVNL